MNRHLIPVCLVAVLAACQPVVSPSAPGAVVTLSDGERCTVTSSTSDGRTLSCPVRGTVSAPPAPEPAPELSDIPGVPTIPTIPRTQAEARCRAGQYVRDEVRGQVRGAVEDAVVDALGLPGNTMGIIRRSQSIARRVDGRPDPENVPQMPSCDGM